MLPLADAVTLLEGFRAGSEDVAGILAEPLVVVDAGPGGDPAELWVPPGFPGVVVAASAGAAPSLPAGSADVAITLTAGAMAPWVQVADLAEAVGELRARVTAAPRAAVTLVEVLRLGRDTSLEEGLVLESLAYSMLQSGPEFGAWRAGRARSAARAEPEQAVISTRSGDVLELTLNRPHVHNAYNARMRDELCEALTVPVADPNCRVVLRGSGPSFCSGGDLDEFGTAPDPATAHLIRTGRSPARLMAELCGRIEVQLHGSCAGSGIELPAFAASIRAAPGTRIWLPELAMGLIPGAGGTVSLARRIGPGRTAWMALSGRVVDEVTALDWGLVDRISGEGE